MKQNDFRHQICASIPGALYPKPNTERASLAGSMGTAPAWPVTIMGRCRCLRVGSPHPYPCASSLSPDLSLLFTFPLLHQLDTWPPVTSGPSVSPPPAPVVLRELLFSSTLSFLHSSPVCFPPSIPPPLGLQEQEGPSSLSSAARSYTSGKTCDLCHLFSPKPPADFHCQHDNI